jgi:sulfoacetaldehyde dehydrogenase
MVKAAYSSGTPAFGVGAGNAQLLVDDTADLADAAYKTMLSKTGDLSAGCSCDNSLIIFESVYDAMIEELQKVGGYLCNAEETAKMQQALFPEWPENHVINRHIVASPIENIAKIAGVSVPDGTKFIMVEESGSGPDHPFSGEKMSLILTVYKCADLDDGIARVNANLAYSGAGHSCGIHSHNEANIEKFALATYTTRCNVNLPNSVANTGDWGVGYPFTGSLGCGTWGGNVVSENIVLKHYLNNTWIASPIEPVVPTDEELFGDIM